MPTRNVVITDHQASFVEVMVASGRYQNVSEVLREGLRLVEERETRHATQSQALQDAIQVGIEDIEKGRFTTFESPKALADHLRSEGVRIIAEEEAKDAQQKIV